jgi:hypothetical protein
LAKSRAECARGIEHMRHHRPTRHRMQDLGSIGAHALSHAGSEHHHIQNDCIDRQNPTLGYSTKGQC